MVDSGSAAAEDARLGEGPVQHFTNAAGVLGITGADPNALETGKPVRVPELAFGRGTNTFLAQQDGGIFVTEIGPQATTGQLAAVGVFGDRQEYVVQFSRESAFANGVRLNPLFPARSIFGIPQGTILGNPAYIYTVTRVRGGQDDPM